MTDRDMVKIKKKLAIVLYQKYWWNNVRHYYWRKSARNFKYNVNVKIIYNDICKFYCCHLSYLLTCSETMDTVLFLQLASFARFSIYRFIGIIHHPHMAVSSVGFLVFGTLAWVSQVLCGRQKINSSSILGEVGAYYLQRMWVVCFGRFYSLPTWYRSHNAEDISESVNHKSLMKHIRTWALTIKITCPQLGQ